MRVAIKNAIETETGVLADGVKYMIDFERGGSREDLEYCKTRLAELTADNKGIMPRGFFITSKNGCAMVKTDLY